MGKVLDVGIWRILVSIVVVSISLGLVACGTNSSSKGNADQIRVSWWGGDTENKGLNAALAALEKNEGVKTLRESQDFNGYWDKLSTQTAAKNAPDLEMQAGSQIPSYASKSALTDLNSVKGINMSGIDPGAKAFGQYNGKLYGLTAAINALGLIVNEEQLKSVGVSIPEGGWTWNQLSKMAQKVHDNSGGKLWGLADNSGDFKLFVLWVRGHGHNLYTDNGKLNATSEDIVSWFKYWDSMRKSGAIPPADVTSEGQGVLANSPFAKGKVAMAFGWTQDFVSFQGLTKDSLAIHLPPYSSSHPSLWVNAASMWSISSTSAKKDTAAKAINYLINNEKAVKAIGTSLGVPPSQKARKIVQKQASDVDKKVFDYMDKVNRVSKPLNRLWPGTFAQSITKFNEVSESIGFGKVSINNGVSDFVADARSAE